MLVSWNWLQEYVAAGYGIGRAGKSAGHGGTEPRVHRKLEDDWAIDLEVTSNRPDCLGHLGVAREISVLWDSR